MVPGRKFAELDSMITGPCNQLAMASARMVLDQPGSTSPFFVYGPAGCGKTHLLEGIWSAMRRMPGRHRCAYLTAEQFTSFFLAALNGQGIPSFRQRYRQVQLLIIDDLQFLANKRATLIELQYTMDSVLRDGGQLVFSADRSPAELSHLGDDIVNRLCGGLVAKMEPQELVTRRQLIGHFAKLRGVQLPVEVQELLATRLAGDARHLQGAVVRIQAHAEAWNRPITCGLAQEALLDLLQAGQSRSLRLDDIERAVCDVFGIDPKKLRSSNRTQRISQPRMLAMYLSRRYTSAALSEIGEFFGRRSHSTVVSADKKIASLASQDHMIRLSHGTCRVDEAIRKVEQRLRVG